MSLVISKECTLCKVTFPVSEFHRDRTYKDGRKSSCKKCQLKKKKVGRQENPDDYRRSTREAMDRYRAANPEKVKARFAAWREVNAEAHRAMCKSHYHKNKGMYLRLCAERRASEILAFRPFCLELFDLVIREAFDLARQRYEVTGINWHVDHIVPLRSKVVCGLHSEYNIAVIPAAENIAKGNRYWPGMP